MIDSWHKSSIDAAVRIGRDFADECPKIAPILNEELDKISKLISEDRLRICTEGLDSPEDPGGTRNEGYLWWKERITYINPGLIPGRPEAPFDILNCDHYQRVIKLLATLLHEMFHQNCVPHPYTYDATMGLLIGMADCTKNDWPDAWCNPITETALRAEADNEAGNRGGAPGVDWKAIAEAVATGSVAGAGTALTLKFAVGGAALGGPIGGVIGLLIGIIVGGITYLTANPC